MARCGPAIDFSRAIGKTRNGCNPISRATDPRRGALARVPRRSRPIMAPRDRARRPRSADSLPTRFLFVSPGRLSTPSSSLLPAR